MSVSVVLTTESKQKKHFLANREWVLYIDGKRQDDFLSHNERVECLKKAIVVFDDELQKAAETFKSHELGAYMWLFTPDFVRGEEISGLFRLLYLKEIILYLSQKTGVSVLHVEVPLDAQTKRFLMSVSKNLNVRHVKITGNRAQDFLQKLKHFYKAFRLNLLQTFQKKNEPFEGTLIDTSSRFHKSRYDNLQNVTRIFNENVKYYSGDQVVVSGIEKNKTVVFKRDLSIEIWFRSLVKAFRINRFIKTHKNQIPPHLYNNHRGLFKMMMYWDLIMAQESMDAYLKKSALKNIVQVSTITKPEYRSLMMFARKHSVRYIQVASRSLTRLRCSERLIKADVEEYNHTALPDAYIFKDKYSLRIFDDFPELQQKSSVGARFLMKNIAQNRLFEKPPALFILFNHRADVSHKLLKALVHSEIYTLFDTIIYRCHPSFVFDQATIIKTFGDKKIIDNTGKDYRELLDYRVLGVSGPTSAALEAVAYGCLVHWAPFVYDDAILMDEVMETVGVKCVDPALLKNKLTEHLNAVDLYNSKLDEDNSIINEYFETDSLISEKIQQILKQA